jgi:hypothetical protein
MNDPGRCTCRIVIIIMRKAVRDLAHTSQLIPLILGSLSTPAATHVYVEP